jgi:hypothetical protein
MPSPGTRNQIRSLGCPDGHPRLPDNKPSSLITIGQTDTQFEIYEARLRRSQMTALFPTMQLTAVRDQSVFSLLIDHDAGRE